MTDVLAEVRGLRRRFGARTALAGVDLVVRRGERLALLGPNGAGKSTLLAVLAGALPPTAGAVRWDPGVRAGWAPQGPGHYARLTARENLELFARLHDVAPAEAEAARLLGALELPGDVRAGELSAGNRQRLNVALALVGEPEVLLLDEPTAALDPGARRRLWDALDLERPEGALVFATQALEELAHADRVALLVGGELAFLGTAADYRDSRAAEVLA